jgi:hypothetical protein
MSLTATFDPLLSRVRLSADTLTGIGLATFERSLNQIRWTTVRGGSSVGVASNAAALDDYEFVPGVTNYYRVNAPGSTFYTDDIAPAQTGVWFKSITRPFLNRAVQVIDHTDITRPARNGIFEVVGRSYPVAVTDVRGSRRWAYEIKAETVSDADALELVFASGDPLYVQTDGLHDIPGGYVVAGDVTRSRFGKVSQRRYFSVPVVEVAPPASDVVGVTSTWETILAEFGSWNAVLAAFGTWAEVADYVADPSVVIVP